MKILQFPTIPKKAHPNNIIDQRESIKAQEEEVIEDRITIEEQRQLILKERKRILNSD